MNTPIRAVHNPFAPPPEHPQLLPQQQPPWSPLDEYLWHTCDIVADLLEGRLDQRPLVASTARLAPGERVLAVGPGQCLTWRAVGDGSYQHNSTFAFGSPAFVIGSMVGSAIGNSSRRRQAERDAQPRWVPDGGGELAILPRRAYLGPGAGDLDLWFEGLSAIDQVGPDVFQASFSNARGHGEMTTVRLHTPWAALLFALSAITAFPAHPLLLSGGWLPPGFVERCAVMGRPCRPAARLALDGRPNG